MRRNETNFSMRLDFQNPLHNPRKKETEIMSSHPQWKNRRLAARALRVIERHKEADPTLASYEATLKPAAEAFIASYDKLRVVSRRRTTELKEGKAAVDALGRSLRSWAGQIEALQLIGGFRANDYGDSPDVPDDVIADAASFMDLLSAHSEINPDSVPYLESLTTDITAKLELARVEWREAEVANTEYKGFVEQNRTAESGLSAHLIAFRRSLANVLGTSHPDYQMLRAKRVKKTDPEDGSTPEETAEDGTTPPAATTGADADDEADEAVGVDAAPAAEVADAS